MHDAIQYSQINVAEQPQDLNELLRFQFGDDSTAEEKINDLQSRSGNIIGHGSCNNWSIKSEHNPYNETLVVLRNENLHLQGQIHDLTQKLQQCLLHRFASLPPELRRKIWKHALPGPRIVSVDFNQRTCYTVPEFTTSHGPPTLLHICRESRGVALEHYELLFQSKSSRKPPFYFDVRRDTLCFTRETTPVRIVLFLEDMPPEDVCRVRRLAVQSELPMDMAKYITQFHGLEVFRLILSDPRVAAPVGKFGLMEAEQRSIWVMGAYWNHGLTSWDGMQMSLTWAFEDERERCPETSVPVVEFVYAVSTEEGCCADCPGHGKNEREKRGMLLPL